MIARYIDFGKCKSFDELCGLLNLLSLQFDGNESHENYKALQPYLGDEVPPMTFEPTK